MPQQSERQTTLGENSAVRITVFFSWQSDLPEHRAFIETTLTRALSGLRLRSNPELEPALDRDTQGEPGSPSIFRTILEKIDRCSAFVADVTPTYRRTDVDARVAPNPNVMIELGYALKTVGAERTLLLLDTAVAAPEQLPFNLRANEVVPFTLAAGSEVLMETLRTKLNTLFNTVPLPSHVLPPVTFLITTKQDQVLQGHIQYKLEVRVTNSGDEILDDWSVEIEVPKQIVIPTGGSTFVVEGRSTSERTVFRIIQEEWSGKPIYPAETIKVFNLLYWLPDAPLEDVSSLMSSPVVTRFFARSRQLARFELSLEQLHEHET